MWHYRHIFKILDEDVIVSGNNLGLLIEMANSVPENVVTVLKDLGYTVQPHCGAEIGLWKEFSKEQQREFDLYVRYNEAVRFICHWKAHHLVRWFIAPLIRKRGHMTLTNLDM